MLTKCAILLLCSVPGSTFVILRSKQSLGFIFRIEVSLYTLLEESFFESNKLLSGVVD